MNREWESEPEFLDFEAEGLPCAMRRGPGGNWCGYVGVPTSHPWYGLTYNAQVKKPEGFDQRKFDEGIGAIELFLHVVRSNQAEDQCSIAIACHVHGSLTYSEPNLPRYADGPKDRGDFWWFGFNCAHVGDVIPDMIGSGYGHLYANSVYRNQSYVVAECQSLAAQLASLMEKIDGEFYAS